MPDYIKSCVVSPQFKPFNLSAPKIKLSEVGPSDESPKAYSSSTPRLRAAYQLAKKILD